MTLTGSNGTLLLTATRGNSFSALIFVEEKLIKYEDWIGVNRAQGSALVTRLANVIDPNRRLESGARDDVE